MSNTVAVQALALAEALRDQLGVAVLLRVDGENLVHGSCRRLADGDGATNLQEFNTVPKTNPYDAASVP